MTLFGSSMFCISEPQSPNLPDSQNRTRSDSVLPTGRLESFVKQRLRNFSVGFISAGAPARN